MQLNLGIRRRLAPLLDGGRDEIELMHAILFSLPGSPGALLRRRDRRWATTSTSATATACARRCSGPATATAASPRRLRRSSTSPPLMDPVYGFQAVNVEAQLRTPTSLLRWLRRFIALRKEHPVFGLGDLRAAARPRTRRSSPTSARFAEDIVLCVHNLARTRAGGRARPLAVRRPGAGRELFGNTEFPGSATCRTCLTLGPRGFFWFQLQDPADGD